jgi:hypothetical protein
MSSIRAISWVVEEKYTARLSGDQALTDSNASSNVSRFRAFVAKVNTYTSPLPVRLDVKAIALLSGEYTGRNSVDGPVMSSRASPPFAGTVQISPPDTKAISVPSGEMEGS